MSGGYTGVSRRVHVCTGTPAHPGRGSGSTQLWAFGYPTLALLLNTSENAVRQAVAERRFNPADLDSVLQYVARRLGWKTSEHERREHQGSDGDADSVDEASV
jgi:hypothetical protein